MGIHKPKRAWPAWARRLSLISGAAGLIVLLAVGTATGIGSIQATAIGTPRTDALRGPEVQVFHVAQTGTWVDVPGAVVKVVVSSTRAPSLTVLRWSGEEACTDVCGLRFEVDGAPTHATTATSPFVYPRDNNLAAASIDDLATLAQGTHTVTLQYRIDSPCVPSCTGLGIFEIHNWQIVVTSSKQTAG